MRDPIDLVDDVFADVGTAGSTSQGGRFQIEVREAHEALTREDPKLVEWAQKMEERLTANRRRFVVEAPPMDKLDRILLVHTAACPGWTTQDVDPLFRPLVRLRILLHRRAGNFAKFWPVRCALRDDWRAQEERVGWRLHHLDRRVLEHLVALTKREGEAPTIAKVRATRWNRKISKRRIDHGLVALRKLRIVHALQAVLLTPVGKRIVLDLYEREARSQWWDGTHTTNEDTTDGPPE